MIVTLRYRLLGYCDNGYCHKLVTACGHRMAHRKWKETKLQPGTAGPGNMLGCCLFYFHFLLGLFYVRRLYGCDSWQFINRGLLFHTSSVTPHAKPLEYRGRLCPIFLSFFQFPGRNAAAYYISRKERSEECREFCFSTARNSTMWRRANATHDRRRWNVGEDIGKRGIWTKYLGELRGNL